MKMKFVFFILIAGAIFALLQIIYKELSSDKNNVRNYKVRFDPVHEKYYITNELPTHDEDVTNFFGKRILYNDKVKATYIVEKLNS